MKNQISQEERFAAIWAQHSEDKEKGLFDFKRSRKVTSKVAPKKRTKTFVSVDRMLASAEICEIESVE